MPFLRPPALARRRPRGLCRGRAAPAPGPGAVRSGHRAARAAASGRDAGRRRCHPARRDRALRGDGLRGRRRRSRSPPLWCPARACSAGSVTDAGRARCRPRRRHRRGARRGGRGAGRRRRAGPLPRGRGAARHRCDAGLRRGHRRGSAPRPARARAACSTRRRSPGRTAASTCPPSARTPSPGLPPPVWAGSPGQAGGVLLLDRAATVAAAEAAGLFLWARAP